MVDEATKRSLAQISLLKTKAGPRDGEQWVNRLKEEYQSLIKVCLTLPFIGTLALNPQPYVSLTCTIVGWGVCQLLN